MCNNVIQHAFYLKPMKSLDPLLAGMHIVYMFLVPYGSKILVALKFHTNERSAKT